MSDELHLSVVTSDCWNTIGVKGDRSCPKLVEARHCHNCPVFAAAARQFLNRTPPDGYLDELTLQMSRSNLDTQKAVAVSAVLFEVGDQTLAIDTLRVVEVTEPRPVHRVGHRTGRLFSGLVNIHGQLELCASLRGLLQISGEAAPDTNNHATARMLLIEHAAQRWVFAADAVLGVHRFSLDQVSMVPATAPEAGSAFVRNLLTWNERRIGYLDVEKTFAALHGSIR
jgi:chemotaxis-related protein WspD